MSGSLTDLLRLLRQANRLLMLGAVVGIALLGYYGMLGIQWWQGTAAASALEEQAATLAARARPAAQDQEALQAQIASYAEVLAEVRQPFIYPHNDDLFNVLTTTAQEAGVVLPTINAGDPLRETHGEIAYQTQPFNITMEGEVEQILLFLEILQERAPVVTVKSIRMGGFSSDDEVEEGEQEAAWAALDLVFLLSPDGPVSRASAEGSP